MLTIEQLAEGVRFAKAELDAVKLRYYHNAATYDDMAEQAKRLANLTLLWQRAKYPTMRVRPVSWKALLR